MPRTLTSALAGRLARRPRVGAYLTRVALARLDNGQRIAVTLLAGYQRTPRTHAQLAVKLATDPAGVSALEAAARARLDRGLLGRVALRRLDASALATRPAPELVDARSRPGLTV